MQQGEVGVSFIPSGTRDILPEAEFTLVDRSFQPGDLCKRSIEDVRSGVVTSVDVQAKLVHAISEEPVEGWKSVQDLKRSNTAEIGDYVLCDDWVGQVRDCFISCQIFSLTSVCQVIEVLKYLSVDVSISNRRLRCLMNPLFKSPAASWFDCPKLALA